MKHTFKRVFSMLCAIVMLLGCFAWSAFAEDAIVDEGDAPSGTMQLGGTLKSKWTIYDETADGGADITVASGARWGFTRSGLGIDLPDSMQLEDIGLYMHFELDANDAALLNASGDAQIELAQTSCDNSELCLQCREATTWVEGENKVLIPFGKKAAFSDGATGPFDLHETINHFRIYSAVASMETTIKVYEVAIVDIGGVDTRKVGSLFGDSDTYLQMDGTLTTPPSSFEASIKMDEDIVKYAGMWEIGLPAAGRYSFITTTTGATTAEDAEDYGIPADTAYQKYLIPQATASNGYFGTSDKKFTAINIPDKYTKADLALTFWVYWKPSVSGTPFNLYSYIELTSSGKSDSQELCWGTDRPEFKNMKEGWNQIVLPFAGASVTGGDIDLSNINFTRIWGNTGADYLATCDYDLRMTSFKIIVTTEEEEGATEEKVTSWSLGLPGRMRDPGTTTTAPTATVDGKYYENKDQVTGTVTAEDVATYGMPAGLQYVGGTVLGGYEYEYATGETDADGKPIMATSNLGGGSVAFFQKTMKTVSVPDEYEYDDLALVFWFYTSTGSLGCDGKYPDVNTGTRNGNFYIELTSSGRADYEEIYWTNSNAAFANVKAGWNLIVLPFSTATKSDWNTRGALNLKNINCTRWGSDGTMSEDVTIYVSEMSVMALPTADDAFDLEYWSLGAPGAPRTDAGSYQMTAKSGTISAVEAVQYDMPYGLSWKGGTVPVGGRVGLHGAWMKEFILPAGDYTTADLDLVFWLYTSTGKLDGSKWYLELSNTGGDDYELCWYQTNPAFSNLQVGWNKIVLPLGKPDYTEAAAGKTPFTLDKPMKYTRLWTTGAATEPVDLYFTDFFIAAHDDPDHQIIDGHETWELVNFSVENGNWDKAVRTFGNVWTNDGTSALQPADGTVYMKVTPSSTATETLSSGIHSGEIAWKAGFDVSVGKGMNPPIISSIHTTSDLVFSFWMYVPDASLVPTDISIMPNFELTSDGNADGAEIAHSSLFGGGLVDGWNYIEMPLSKMTAQATFDLYNINYVRWSNMRLLPASGSIDTLSEENDYVYFADFRLTSTLNSGVLVDASEIDLTETYTILSTADSTDENPITLFVNYKGNPGFIWGDKAYVAENYCAVTGEWVDLALTYDAENAQFIMYANGEIISYVDATGVSAITPTVGFAIGADVDGTNLMTGYIADVRIWSDVRTQQEIIDNRVEDKEAFGAVENGLDETTEGLIGAWTLVGGLDYVLENKPDLSASGIDLVHLGSRADDWDLDYQIPTDVIGEDYYSIVFIPDTQNLVTGKYNDEWEAIGDWIVANIEKENVIHVIGAGDTTWNDTIPEYERAIKVWNQFTDKVSWSNIIGNHDYPWKSNTQTIRDPSNYNHYYGIDYINSTMGSQYYMGSFDDPYDISGTENSYYRFNINGTPWMILQLEYHPRVSVINWANEIAQMYPDDNIILTTHSYIGTDNAAHSGHWMTYTKEDVNIGGFIGSLMNPPQVWNYQSFTGASDKSTEEPVWTHLIYNNPNIKMLLCGHSSTTDGHVLARWDKNVAGETIPQIMINGQDVDETYFVDHGMGMIGILRFSADGSKMDIQYYSPYHKASYHPSNQNMRSHTLSLNKKEEVAGTDGLVYELNEDKAGYTIVDYTGDATDVIVPETYEGLPVTAYAPRLDVTTDGDGSIVLPDDYVDGTVVEKEELTLDSITFLSKTITIVDDPATIKATTVIHGYVGSTAAAYAKALGAELAYLASISGVSVSLGKDIGLIYSAYMTEEDAANAEMEFVMNGKTTTATAVATATAGKYTFALTGKGPHLMRDNVTARLLVNGEAVATLNDYSVRRYCTNIMGKIDAGTSLGISEAKTTALRTLIADLLEYGAAAQLYVNHKPLNLANEGITGASIYVELTDEYAPEALGATTAADGSRFISGSVELTDVVTMHIVFAADKANIDKVKVTVNGRVYTSASFQETTLNNVEPPEGLTVYEITSPAIWATQFEQKCSLVLNIDGTDCQTFNYSVVNYIYRQQNVTTNDKLVNLLRTIRNYGLSAEAYRDAK